jgi:hypothetical protein
MTKTRLKPLCQIQQIHGQIRNHEKDTPTKSKEATQAEKMKYATGIFLLILFRSWGLELLGLSTEQFYQIYDLIPSLIGLLALKIAAGKLTIKWQRIVLDFMLAVLWADVIDRALGITEFRLTDYLLIGFFALALLKHTLLNKYSK